MMLKEFEAKGTLKKVAEGTFVRAEPTRVRQHKPQLRVGCDSDGPIVEFIQSRLKDLGFYHGTLDGSFGSYTSNAVSEFQRKCHITPTGEVDLETWVSLVDPL